MTSIRSTQRRPVRRRALQGDHPEADRLDTARGEVGAATRHTSRRSRPCPGWCAAVAGPRLGVLGRVLHVALDDPRVQPGAVEPLAPTRSRQSAAAGDLPVAEELGDAAGLEDGRRPGARGRARRRRPARAAVAVLVQRHGSATRGVMTKGGLLTTRSNRCPATGSSRSTRRRTLPRRASSSAALNRAIGQRPLGEVGGDDRAGVPGRGAGPARRSRCRGRARGRRRRAGSTTPGSSRRRRCRARGPRAAGRRWRPRRGRRRPTSRAASSP